MESPINEKLSVFQEARDKAFTHLFTLDENQSEPAWSAIRWDSPKDAEERFRAYVKAELALQKNKIQAARPRFDTEASKDEMIFQNAENYLTNGEHGKESLERVLKRLYRFQKQREYAFGNNKAKEVYDRPEYQSEWINILASQSMVGELAERFIGRDLREKFHKPYSLWKDYE